MNLNDNPFVSSPEVVQARRRYRCVCGQAVFFRNSQCLNCGRALGYENGRLELVPLEPARASDPTLLRVAGDVDAALYVRCANFETPAGCNWILPLHERDAGQTLCRACRLNRTIPDLSVREHAQGWRLIEIAKRRLVSQLLALRLPVASKLVEDPQRGLAFDILAAPPGGRVMTGHADGLITLDVAEADDAYRERERRALGEPYRTLLGHFRHEAGHYYWDRLVEGSRWLGDFRALFGDERADYSAALRSNYERAPPADWPARFVSRYASVHPWEDWAETWAHYLHIVDTLDTAASYGLDAGEFAMGITPIPRDALWRPDAPDAARLLQLLNSWVEITAVLNEMSRSMGQHDFYPFVMPRPAVAKLQFIHMVVADTAQQSR
jgi:hypothetical protein